MTGIFVLKAIPLHLGHIHAINLAASQCDKLYVILCYSKHDDDFFRALKLNPIPFLQRYKWLLEIYQDINHIQILLHNEGGIPPYPYGWEQWSKSIKKLLKQHKSFPNRWFSSELGDMDNAKKYFPETDFILIDPKRKEIPISATKIRKNGIYKYWEYLPGVVRPFFAKKVVLIGTESTGKSTLTKFLAKKFNTSWTEEYGREYVEKYCFGKEDLLTFDDYAIIAQRHKMAEAKALRTANKVTFTDTEAIITQFYCLLNNRRSNVIVDAIAKAQKYDLWLFLTKDVPWVADNIRQHREDRASQEEQLVSLCKKYGVYADKIVVLDGDYLQRMEKAIKFVDYILED